MRGRASDFLFVAGLAAVGFGYLQFVYRPAVRDVSGKMAEVNRIEAAICQSDDFTRGIDDLETYLEDFAASLSDLDRLVPETVENNGRIRDMAELVTTIGLEMGTIRPDKEMDKGGIVSHPITLKVAGSYEQILNLLARIESLPQLTRVTRAMLERKDAREGHLEAEIEVTSYSVEGGAS